MLPFENSHDCPHYFYFLPPRMNKKLEAFILLKTELVDPKELKPAKWNPRIITDKRFKKLCESIEEDPQFMVLRPILASKKGIIYAGNMRFRALVHLGAAKVPVIYTDIDEKKAKLRSLKDNNHFGEYQMDELATLVVEFEPLKVELTGMPESIMRQIQHADADHSAKNEEVDVSFTANKLEHTCPKCGFAFACDLK